MVGFVFPGHHYLRWSPALLGISEHFTCPWAVVNEFLVSLCLHAWLLLSVFNWFYFVPHLFYFFLPLILSLMPLVGQ